MLQRFIQNYLYLDTLEQISTLNENFYNLNIKYEIVIELSVYVLS